MRPARAETGGDGIRAPVSEGSNEGARIAFQGIPERRVPPCAHCHEDDYEPHPAYPRLEGQYRPYLVQQLELFARGVRGGAEFAGLMQKSGAHALRPQEIQAVSQHYAAASAERPTVE